MSTKKPIDVESLDKDAFHEWVNSFDIVLSDCDGNAINVVFGECKNQ